ncbi:ribonuclease III [Oscillochloris sp. ZM17-4]|uniref:ribonuclease III n=1 Tax=Oscillochloris sp. ZM17-4 TaxID=2866714 RepID=UPI001C72EDEA|nr:ribonuclease III [Oscillochloris sp. ZM17-4]MBX0328724.1 ribonuclease III [Oscillochloris sp. ZM17-4]
MEDIQQQLGVRFTDEGLLMRAFVHRSFIHEHPERNGIRESNERLEFLGDAVLNFLTAAWLYERFPERTEGELTHLRAALVKTNTLAGFSRELDLSRHIKISRGEDTPVSRNRPALLADVFESLLGAIFLDQGLDAVREFVSPFLERQMAAVLSGAAEIDYRTRLQERAQSIFNRTPAYRMVGVAGPDHEREFTMEVTIGEVSYGVGVGPSKQLAAQAAAREALGRLQEPDESPDDVR